MRGKEQGKQPQLLRSPLLKRKLKFGDQKQSPFQHPTRRRGGVNPKNIMDPKDMTDPFKNRRERVKKSVARELKNPYVDKNPGSNEPSGRKYTNRERRQLGRRRVTDSFFTKGRTKEGKKEVVGKYRHLLGKSNQKERQDDSINGISLNERFRLNHTLKRGRDKFLLKKKLSETSFAERQAAAKAARNKPKKLARAAAKKLSKPPKVNKNTNNPFTKGK